MFLPTATVALTRKQQLLQGQPYTIHLTLELPDSPVNEDHGMFMSCMNISTTSGQTIAQSCKSAVAEYRSPLLRTMETLAYSPFLLTGFSSQKQTLNMYYFTNFHPDPHTPAELINIEVKSNNLQVSSALLHLEASLTGLRHLMYRHPWLSSVLGVGTNILIISTVIAVSWARFNQAPEESGEAVSDEEIAENKEDSNDSNMIPVPEEMAATATLQDSGDESSVAATVGVDFPKASLLSRLRWFVIRSLVKLILRIVILAMKIAVPLVIVTACYEIHNLGYEDPQLVIEAGKEDLLFLAAYMKEKIMIAMESYK